MYNDLGALKVTDFGLARAFSPDTPLFGRTGTVDYMAPELFRSEGYSGPEVDVFALGVLMHALLDGSFPFQWQIMKVSVPSSQSSKSS